MPRLTDEQRRVLRYLKRRGAGTPDQCKCRVSTFVALANKGLIQVDTTFASVVYPKSSARAVVTSEGVTALRAA